MAEEIVMQVQKRDGTVVAFTLEKIAKVIFKAARAVGGKDTSRATHLAGLVAKDIEKHFPGKEIPTVEDIQDSVEKVLIDQGHVKTAKAFILYRKERMKLREEKAGLIGKTESNKLSINAIRLLRARYLKRDKHGKIVETPNEMFRRVAKNVARAEKKWKKDPKVAEEAFYNMMFHLDFLPNSPTLMNAGTKTQQLISCFVLPLEDDISNIFNTLKLAMDIQKTGAGTGFSFSQLRQRGALLGKNGYVSSGPIPFLEVFDQATNALKQGGTGRGANMGVLRVDHPDIREFIHAKEKEGSMTNFNISIGVTDEFMVAVQKNDDYILRDPRTKEEVDNVSARYIWDSFVASAWKNGDPGILFLDRINKDNVTPETPIEATSPCAESPMQPNEACVLGSINLGNMVTEHRKIDWKRLQHVILTGVHLLDNVIEVNDFPTKEIKEKTLYHRKIGLGVMGFADMLVKLRLPYNSEKGVKAGKKVIRFIRKEADKASHELAKQRGSYPALKKSKKKPRIKMRNATRLSIAPTGSISMIADCSSGIEPLFAISYIKRVMGGKQFFYLDGAFKDALKEHNLYKEVIIDKIVNQASVRHIKDIPLKLRKVFVVAHDITPEWHLKMQAACQESVDNAISKTVNFPNRTTMKDIEKVYFTAWKNKCKGITIYRDGSKQDQVVQLNF